jgi:hypothetical protein
VSVHSHCIFTVVHMNSGLAAIAGARTVAANLLAGPVSDPLNQSMSEWRLDVKLILLPLVCRPFA